MFSKDLTMNYLLDFYRELLSPRQYEVLSLYYGDDLSLSEIAEELGISRQGVRHIIKKGEEQLRGYEDGLGLAGRFSESRRAAEEIAARLEKLKRKTDDAEILKEIDEISRLTAFLAE
ncbi:MAG: sigma-70 family RNA polymerase sigma factor [Clostridia bacterium]|nr:sigma-70 family RNA polymerase sigma factor [Clostridia bacterium]